MRERSKYAIRAALVILIVIPAIWLTMYFVFKAFGIDHPLNPFVLIWLLICCAGLSVYKFANMSDRGGP